MKTVKQMIQETDLNEAFYQAVFGIEKEGLRVKSNGQLALTDHPHEFGNRNFHPYIQTDFSESQLELISPPLASIKESYNWMAALHDVVLQTMPLDESIWPVSMPMVLPDESVIPIAKLDNKEAVKYREILTHKYGKKKQMLSGVHYNFELDDQLIARLYECQTDYSDKSSFKSMLYLKLAKNFLRYRWLLTYLLGASPKVDDSFFTDQEIPKDYVRSIRSSHYGYVNQPEVAVSFNSIEDYVHSLQTMVEKGFLSEEKEFYSAVRLRGTNNAEKLLTEGVSYLELRGFDLNPFDPFGMSKQTIEFIHLFCLYMIWMDETATVDEIEIGEEMSLTTAIENPEQISNFQEEGLQLLKQMEEMLQATNGSKEAYSCIQEAKKQIIDPKLTVAARIISGIEEKGSYIEFSLALAKQYKKEAVEKPYNLRGFEKLEMSTQLLIMDAFQKGIQVEVLDEQDQFLKLTVGKHIEFVKNGNMTSKDTYIAPLIMENKTVTKKILGSAGFHVPAGEEYTTLAEGKAAFWRYEQKQIVVKPKSTNYGIGISIFKQLPSREDYEQAIEIAFKEDTAVLVEEYIPGTEYRFFVLDGKVPAILLRTPANVVGDGKKTIKELVDKKNEDPLRGEVKHHSPLERIELGEIEQLMLKGQGYTVESIPETDTVIYLRENSNISTGGDSIDVTDDIDESYKQAAIDMSEIIGAKVSGIDLIIPDPAISSTKEHLGYTVLEANFNPAMHMHAFVYKGKGRRLTMGILKMLFPELWEKGKLNR
ncbi:bifunctional glutamate--cysteine ligase GshA/glutathione synthetase GshB [Carnobacterium sp. ISL-102]|uniref:bifunctional glutamate--cysteine ligase GshA/glutathione synthetase GshB n=1 Tax=Carnobacterium sp. ISL-102 TaxID=2819142 RepID=UPI001BE500E0|nr:bifunctional glutamate--cysteine ligase GshA/glutathione synthetase GshB [Carnobacterium sp. ISL-102]MBT2731688.1 bifunctional glutamate--cysteine ligase GshA/glutathione synthetase GshB [Carnobacterium sp. ISL-102]